MLRPVLALAATLGLAAAADAQYPFYPAVPVPYPVGYPPVVRPHHRPRCDRHVVLYKTCAFGPWTRYGTYCSEEQARCAARELRRSGYRVKVDACD